jgi:alpha-beta hydrolase superfamily lysophospholipase
MDVSHRQGRLVSDDGRELFEQSWSPAEPEVALGLVHGYAEHSGRYDAAARHLADAGVAVQALDLRGHGRSDGKRCYVGDFREFLSDVDAMLLHASHAWTGIPLFLMGHSLGGLIAACYVIDRAPLLSGLVLSAPSVSLGDDFPLLRRRLAELAGRALPWLPTVRFPSESLSRDASVVEGYRADALVYHGRTPARTASEIIRAIRRVQERMEAIELPLLVMHGSRDQVADVEGSRMLHEHSSSCDKTLRVYEGLYHEIMNEPERESVLGELAEWLAGHSEPSTEPPAPSDRSSR